MKTSKFHTLMILGLTLGVASGTAWAQDGEDNDPEAVETVEQPEDSAAPVNADGAVEASVDEIEMLINLPKTAQLGRESDEDLSKANDIFADARARQTLLEPEPRFIYVPSGQDPMIIPWIRNQIVAQELLADATAILSKANATKDATLAKQALQMAEAIIEKYSDTAEVEKARTLAGNARTAIAAIERPDDSGTQVVIPTGVRPEGLPPWVLNNTTGVIVDRSDPKNSIVLLGDDLVKPGDRVKRFPTVTVKQVLPEQVIYEYQGSEYLVAVKSSE